VFNFAALSSKKGVLRKKRKGIIFRERNNSYHKGVSIDKSGLGYNAHKHKKPTGRLVEASGRSVINQ